MIGTMIKALFNCAAIFFLLIVIGILLVMLLPALGKSLHHNEMSRSKSSERQAVQKALSKDNKNE